MGDSHVGLQARLMSQALRKLTGTIPGAVELTFQDVAAGGGNALFVYENPGDSRSWRRHGSRRSGRGEPSHPAAARRPQDEGDQRHEQQRLGGKRVGAHGVSRTAG